MQLFSVPLQRTQARVHCTRVPILDATDLELYKCLD